MAKRKSHLRLDHLVRKLVAKPPKEGWDPSFSASFAGRQRLLDKLQKERLELTDFAFRQRYAAWL
jgi:hypothetical protein